MLQKDGVREGEFDWWMVWYWGEREEMNRIYENVEKGMESSGEVVKKERVGRRGEVRV